MVKVLTKCMYGSHAKWSVLFGTVQMYDGRPPHSLRYRKLCTLKPGLTQYTPFPLAG
jgi:hypothetical protein